MSELRRISFQETNEFQCDEKCGMLEELTNLFKNNRWYICECVNPKPMKQVVPYYRVSTVRQGESGLGLEAQQESVGIYITARRLSLLKEFTEVESSRKNHRPVLNEAIEYCKLHKAVLLIAQLDRLGRNVAFISTLMESEIEFVAVDFPEATPLMLHIMAAFAQYEAEMISKRTKSALQAAKKNGVLLGKNGKKLAEMNKELAKRFSQELKPQIIELRLQGYTTVEAITDQLNKRNISTYRPGCRWHKSTVHKLLSRLDKCEGRYMDLIPPNIS